MLTPLGDVAALVALLTGIVTILLQIIKPLLEQIPVMARNEPVHDAVLRLVNLLLQAGLLAAARLTLAQYGGLTWLDILALAFGQGMLAHAGYQIVRSVPSAVFGSNNAPPAAPVGGETSGA